MDFEVLLKPFEQFHLASFPLLHSQHLGVATIGSLALTNFISLDTLALELLSSEYHNPLLSEKRLLMCTHFVKFLGGNLLHFGISLNHFKLKKLDLGVGLG